MIRDKAEGPRLRGGDISDLPGRGAAHDRPPAGTFEYGARRGLIGDRAGSLQAVGPDWEPASSARTLVRAGVPILVGIVGIVLGLGPTMVVVYFGAGLWAALRADRRGPWELVSGVNLVAVERATREVPAQE